MLSSSGSDWKTIHVKRINQETGETTGVEGRGRQWAVGRPPCLLAACRHLLRASGCSLAVALPLHVAQGFTVLPPCAPQQADLEDKLDHVKFSVSRFW